MQYTRKYEKYHYKYDITDEKQIQKDMENFVNKQTQEDVFPIFTVYERIRNSSEKVTVCPLPTKQIVPYHKHDYYELNYISSGICYQYINNKIYKMKQGDLIILSDNTFHTIYLPEGSTGINIIISQSVWDDMFKNQRKPQQIGFINDIIRENINFILFNCQNSPFILSCLDELCRAKNKPLLGASSLEYMQRLQIINCIICELILGEANQSIGVQKSVIFDSMEPTNTNVIEYINANFATVTQAELQKIFGFSKMGFYRYIKTNTGNNFCVYVGSLKYNRACYLLQYSSKNISSIAHEIGFESTEYFSRFFKKQAAITPTEYRRRFKAK